MSVSQDHAIAIQRQVSLFEALILALGTHAVILVILSLFGLLSLFTARPPKAEVEQDMQVRFTVAPESAEPLDEGPPALNAAPSDMPPVPDAGETTELVALTPDSPASLDQPSPPIPAIPSGQPDPRPTTPAEALPVAPIESLAGTDEAAEPPSDGLPDGIEQEPDSEPELDSSEPVDEPDASADPVTDTLSTGEAEVETSRVLPQTDDGIFTEIQQAKAALQRNSPAPGRPEEPSFNESISDFGRALREQDSTAFQQPGEAPRNSFQPDWPNLPTTGQALGNMYFESGDYDWTEYQRQIYWIIWRSWHRRLLARVDDFEKWAQLSRNWYMDHSNVIRFTIERNGEISSIAVETESGMLALDLSSVEGLDEAVLPPLPDDFQRDSETIHAQFIGQGQISLMRRGLMYYRDAGVF